MRKRPSHDADYPVGYGKPPEASKFKKGQSGNPKGRPKGSMNVATILRRAAYEKVTVTEHGRQKQITKLEAAAKQLANRAAAGDLKAFGLLLPQLALIDASLATEAAPELDANDQAVMAALVQRFAQHGGAALAPAQRNGKKPPSKTPSSRSKP